jgi:outer membrane protein assembly factor BamB
MKQNSAAFILGFLLLCGLAWSQGVQQPDAAGVVWPQWRGPNGDGVSTESGWNPTALNGGAKILWNVDVGPGFSNIAIKDNCLYALGYDAKANTLLFWCLDAATGNTIWKKSLNVPGQPESTPVVDGDRVYGLGWDGTLFCLQAANSRLVWQKNLVKDFNADDADYRWATSPVVEGDLILLNATASGLALNKLTGDLA